MRVALPLRVPLPLGPSTVPKVPGVQISTPGYPGPDLEPSHSLLPTLSYVTPLPEALGASGCLLVLPLET